MVGMLEEGLVYLVFGHSVGFGSVPLFRLRIKFYELEQIWFGLVHVGSIRFDSNLISDIFDTKIYIFGCWEVLVRFDFN